MYGRIEKFQKDPNWQNFLMFHEYFHGDNGYGLVANHQTGWTGLVAVFIELFYNTKAQEALKKHGEKTKRRKSDLTPTKPVD